MWSRKRTGQETGPFCVHPFIPKMITQQLSQNDVKCRGGSCFWKFKLDGSFPYAQICVALCTLAANRDTVGKTIIWTGDMKYPRYVCHIKQHIQSM